MPCIHEIFFRPFPRGWAPGILPRLAKLGRMRNTRALISLLFGTAHRYCTIDVGFTTVSFLLGSHGLISTNAVGQ